MPKNCTKTYNIPFEHVIEKRFFTSLFLLRDLKVKIVGDKWVWHQNDQDHLPSFPHLHGQSTSYKIDIYTGKVYDTKCKKIINTISKKELKKIWQDTEFIQHIHEKRALYEQEFYDGVRYKALPEIPQF